MIVTVNDCLKYKFLNSDARLSWLEFKASFCAIFTNLVIHNILGLRDFEKGYN